MTPEEEFIRSRNKRPLPFEGEVHLPLMKPVTKKPTKVMFQPREAAQEQKPLVTPLAHVVHIAENTPPSRTEAQLEKARRRQSVFLQKRREHKKRRVALGRFKAMMRLVYTAVLLVGFYILSIQPFWQFNPSNVALHDNQLIQKSQLAPILSKYTGQYLYQINPMTVEKSLTRAIPLAQSFHVRRRLFPVGLDISVTEKPSWGVLYTAAPSIPKLLKPAKSTKAAFPENKPMALLHWDNSITSLSPYPNATQLIQQEHPVPLISNTGSLNPKKIEIYRTLAMYLSHIPKTGPLLSLNISQQNNIIAQYRDFQVQFGPADSTALSRLSRLSQILPAIRQRQNEIEYVDLRWNQQVLFKKKANAKPAPNPTS